MQEVTVSQSGNKGLVFYHPETEEVARSIGFDNILTGKIVAKVNNLRVVKISAYSLEVISREPIGTEVYLCLRPEAITISIEKPVISDRNIYPGEINRQARLRGSPSLTPWLG